MAQDIIGINAIKILMFAFQLIK